MAYNVLICR